MKGKGGLSRGKSVLLAASALCAALVLVSVAGEVTCLRSAARPGSEVPVGAGVPSTAAPSGVAVQEELRSAAMAGDEASLARCLAAGADVNAKAGTFRDTALHLAAAHGRLTCVQFLLAHGADVESRDCRGYTPLHTAAEAGHLDVAKYLLEKGANPNALDSGGGAPLHNAVDRGHADIVRLLLLWDAEVNVTDVVGVTPLHLAMWRARDEIGRLVLEAGAEHNVYTAARYGDTTTLIHLLTEEPIVADSQDVFGRSPLHWAALGGNVCIAEMLLTRGLNVNVREGGDAWRTPLHLAAEAGHAQLLGALLDSGALVNAIDNYGMTALHYACRGGHVEAAELLVSRGADVNARWRSGPTPLDEARRAHQYEMAEILSQHGAIQSMDLP